MKCGNFLRVKQGGHAIPPDTIRRRYAAGLRNLIELYLPLVDTALIVKGASKQNSMPYNHPIIAEKHKDGSFKISDEPVWQSLLSTKKEGAS